MLAHATKQHLKESNIILRVGQDLTFGDIVALYGIERLKNLRNIAREAVPNKNCQMKCVKL